LGVFRVKGSLVDNRKKEDEEGSVGCMNVPKQQIDWWQLVMFLLALLCFSGAAFLWTHSGQFR
jgi:hypothetical protein